MDRNDPKYSNDPTLAPNERTPGWEPVVGTTYEPQDERAGVAERDVDHHDNDTTATHEHGNEAVGAGAGVLGGAAVGMAVGGPPGAVIGGAIGGVAGAVAGEASEGHDKAGAGTGALGGAAAGALVGGAVAGPPGAVVGAAVGAGAGAGAGDKTEEHVEGEDTTAYDTDTTGYDRR